MTQYEQVVEVMKRNGGYATLGFLNQTVDVSAWQTKTPFATIRRIVQDEKTFFKIKPGLWALNEKKKEVIQFLRLSSDTLKDSQEVPQGHDFNHTYYQGLIVEIGNLKEMQTYVPAQDKNKLYLGKPISSVSSSTDIPSFSYPKIVSRSKTVDVIWFNKRGLPDSFYEVEHSTDIQNSLMKFFDLRDFHARFYIVAHETRKREFEKKLNFDAFSDIKSRVKFIDYENIARLHTKSSELKDLESLL